MKTISGFTILELLTALVIIGILATLLIPVVSTMHARAQRIQCTANLRNLYIAANLDLQQKGAWPQIQMADNSDTAQQDYAKQWINELAPFGVTQKSWICPTVQNLLGNPNFSKTENLRIDYIAMPFDDKPMTPFGSAVSNQSSSRIPWFLEVANAHANGNLIVFSDGSISDSEALKTASPVPTP